MSIADEIGYELEIQENMAINDIKESHKDGICIWVNGSGPSSSEEARYRIVMEAGALSKYMEKECPGKTANQVMLTGIIDALKCVLRPMKIYTISATALGFEKGLKGKGVNTLYFQKLFDLVREKKCQITEVQWKNGSYDLKKYIYSKSPDIREAQNFENKQNEKQLRFKECIYRECLEKVTAILKEHYVNENVIRKVNNVNQREN